MGDRNWWKATLHQGKNPFDGLEGEKPPGYWQSVGGWNSVFRDVVQSEKPREIVEVGTWIGRSAVEMSSIQRKLGIDESVTVCVDTWLGYPDWREWEGDRVIWKHQFFESLRIENGFPRLYDTFAKAIVFHELEEFIVPFPATSTQAYKWMKARDVRPDLIYIDGDHSEIQTYEDMKNYYDLLPSGKLMFGDDYDDPTWGGVTRAVDRFVKDRGIVVDFFKDDNRKYKRYWMIRKN